MISIIVVNWNAGVQLKQCIESLVGADGQIIIVDNASTDGSERVVANYPGVILIRSAENAGFGKGCNLGAEHASGDFLLFLNPDAAVYPGTLERALEFMRDPLHAQVGICGVQLVDEMGIVARSCARFPAARRFLAQACGLDRLLPRLGHFMAEWPHDCTREVDQVMGAFFLVRRELFESLGGFDERFFVYFEEVDFSYRARQAGWRSVYLANVQAFHAGGGTSRQVKARRLFYSLRSRLLYAAKHFSVPSMALVVFVTLLIEPISRSALGLARGSWSALSETWQGYAMLLRWLPQWVVSRRTR